MLEVALAPAPVAYRIIDQGRRIFLVAAFGQRDHMNTPAATTQQRRFDQVVAHDRTAKRRPAFQGRKTAAFGKGAHPNNGVMTPETALRARPPDQSRSRYGAVEPCCELLPPAEQAGAARDCRHGLDEPDIGVSLHRMGELEHGLAAHQAVGIQHDHMGIGATEAANPFGDVAGLALGIDRTAAIINLHRAVAAQSRECHPFGAMHLRIGTVAQHENIERRCCAGLFQRMDHGPQATENGADILVIDRHQYCGSSGRARRLVGQQAGLRPPSQQDMKTGKGATERQRDPCEQRQEQHQQHGFDGIDAMRYAHPHQLRQRNTGQRDNCREQHQPAIADIERRRRRRSIAPRARAKRLNRHRQRRFIRQVRRYPSGRRLPSIGGEWGKNSLHTLYRFSQVSPNAAPLCLSSSRSSAVPLAGGAKSKLTRTRSGAPVLAG